MKLITVVGARPQFIKAGAVSKRIIESSKIEEIIIHTGQHFDANMSDIFFQQMSIPRPKYQLNVNGLSHGAMTGQMLKEIEEVIQIERPAAVMVYGDTNSTLAGALAAKKIGVKVIHIESGLRSFNMQMPEEINRILTDRISDILFCPTQGSIDNLKDERLYNFQNQVYLSGDVMEDAFIHFSQYSQKNSNIIQELGLQTDSFVLCTIHRQENTDDLDSLRKIINILNGLSSKLKIIFPIHPRTKKIIQQNNIALNFNTIDPLGYFDILELLNNTQFLVTDSGGMQKEAYFANKFCITLRQQTEWVELQNSYYNFVVGNDEVQFLDAVKHIETTTFVKRHDFYGGGSAADFIVRKIEELV